jgi:hypothetical protein
MGVEGLIMDITYCSKLDCVKVLCPYNQFSAPKGQDISIAERDDGCYQSAFIHENRRASQIAKPARAALLMAICNATQRTSYNCDDVCRAMCGQDGTCAYCATIADGVEEVIRRGN